VIHQGLIFELTIEAAWVANAIPRFDTHKRCLFAKGAPKSHDWRVEANRHLWLSRLIQQFGAMQLTLMNLDRVIAPSVL
jgi:hypothetical protein